MARPSPNFAHLCLRQWSTRTVSFAIRRGRGAVPIAGRRPRWLTFDCYGTLIQWDEGLVQAAAAILAKQAAAARVEPRTLIHAYDAHEHALEEARPHRAFRSVAADALRMAMDELGLSYAAADIESLTSGIAKMPPFPEVVGALAALKRQGFNVCIISNTDDDIIAGNVAALGGHIDRVITAQQAQCYKPARGISTMPTGPSAAARTMSCTFAPAPDWISQRHAISGFAASGSIAAAAARHCRITRPTKSFRRSIASRHSSRRSDGGRNKPSFRARHRSRACPRSVFQTQVG